MPVSERERRILRGLARQVAEAAALGVQGERIRLWNDFNALRPQRPMVLAFPEGGWRDIVDDSHLQCDDPLLRGWELGLRRRAWHAGHIHDDHPVTDLFNVAWILRIGDCGVVEQYTRTEALGSHVWDAPIKRPADLSKLHPRALELDRPATARRPYRTPLPARQQRAPEILPRGSLGAGRGLGESKMD